MITVALPLPVSKSRPPTVVFPRAVGCVVKPPLKTAVSLAVVALPPDQFDPMAHVELEVPVHVILAACAAGTTARRSAAVAVRSEMREGGLIFMGCMVVGLRRCVGWRAAHWPRLSMNTLAVRHGI